jgi:heptaprenylglyceryl phosphate synthase
MNVGEGSVLSKVCRPTEGARHITLIDPAKQSPEVAAQRAMVAVECGTAMIFVGGSTDTRYGGPCHLRGDSRGA